MTPPPDSATPNATAPDPRAVHLPGGNYFDDLRLDIAASHRQLDLLPPPLPRPIRRSRLRNLAALYLTGLLVRLRLHESLVVTGLRRRWLDDFERYWADILNGRPFWNIADFFCLAHDYRKRQQYTDALQWSDPAQHLANWQQPSQLYSTLFNVKRLATSPITSMDLWRLVRPRMSLLEYGCSLAPYYSCYREFFNHLDCRWTLADIPNFPFHYARHLYRRDPGVDLVTIDAKDFSDPLGQRRDYDAIILTTVLEHLDEPLLTARYLLDRLKPGGLFVFDYIKSEGTGLDHPNALRLRDECLRHILSQVKILHGRADDLSRSVPLCVARKNP